MVPWHGVVELIGGATQSPPAMPLTDHATPVAGVAVKACVAPAETVGPDGLTEMACAFVTVTVAVPIALLLACEVAVIVTLPLGTAEGAVYTPLESMLPPPVAVQVTAVFVVPTTLALKVWVPLTGTLAVRGVTLTEILLLELPPPHAVMPNKPKIAVVTSALRRTFLDITGSPLKFIGMKFCACAAGSDRKPFDATYQTERRCIRFRKFCEKVP